MKQNKSKIEEKEQSVEELNKKVKISDEDILEEFNVRLDHCKEYYSDFIKEAKTDFQFRAGKQWDDKVKKAREANGGVAEVISKLNQYVKTIVNDQKRKRPECRVKASDEAANNKTSLIYQTIISSIQNKSFAECVIDQAFDHAVTCGLGFFRITNDYIDKYSFDQELRLEPVKNPLDVYLDPDFEINYDNINYVIYKTEMTKSDFKLQYPNVDLSTYKIDDNYDGKNICLYEYSFIMKERVKFYLLEGKITISKEDYDNIPGDKPEILKEKDTFVNKVIFVKLTTDEVLEKQVFPGSRVPWIPVFGDVFLSGDEDDKIHIEGIVRQTRSAQKLSNYITSVQIEQISSTTRSQWIAAKGQTEKYERMYNDANYRGILKYDPVMSDGKETAPPSRVQSNFDVSPLMNLKSSLDEDMKGTTGMYNSSLGQDAQTEKSGVAILAKQQQGETNNSHYVDNLAKSLKLCATILLEIIPDIYDIDRKIRIFDSKNPEKDEILDLSEEPELDFRSGRYDVEVSIGPFGSTEKSQAIESISTVISASPELLNVVGDVYFSLMDFKDSDVLAERFKKMLPAELQSQEEQDSASMQQQMTDMQQQYEAQLAENANQLLKMQVLISQLTASLNSAESKLYDKTADLQSKEKINAQNNMTKLTIEQMKIDDNKEVIMQEMQQQQYLKAEQFGEELPPKPQFDTTILPGVNDPVTEAADQTAAEKTVEEQGINPDEVDERDNVLASLQQHVNTPRGNFIV